MPICAIRLFGGRGALVSTLRKQIGGARRRIASACLRLRAAAAAVEIAALSRLCAAEHSARVQRIAGRVAALLTGLIR